MAILYAAYFRRVVYIYIYIHIYIYIYIYIYVMETVAIRTDCFETSEKTSGGYELALLGCQLC